MQTALSRNLKKKGSFSPEEDQIILQIIRNWDTDDTDDRKYVTAGSGSIDNQCPVLEDFLRDAVGCSSDRRSGSSSSSSERGSGDVANCKESRHLLSSSDSSATERIDYTSNSLPSVSINEAQEWLGTGVGTGLRLGTGVRLGTGTGSGPGGKSGVILSSGNVKKSKVPRKGKWVVVGDALNRPPDCCSQRYRDTLIKRPYPLS